MREQLQELQSQGRLMIFEDTNSAEEEKAEEEGESKPL